MLFFVAIATSGFSQNHNNENDKFSHRQSIQAELFGHGLLYSINYEYVLINQQKFKTAAQVGISYYPPTTSYIPIWIPIGINEIISFGKHHLEVGIGQVITTEMGHNLYGEEERDWEPFLSGRLGYRYQQAGGRLVVRAGLTPLFEYGPKDLHLSGALTVGYCF